MSDQAYNVLFLCHGNSARSIMAEAIFENRRQGPLQRFTAGSMPKAKMHPFTLKRLERLEHEADGLRSKSWDAFKRPEAPRMDFVFTVCDDCDDAESEVCLLWHDAALCVRGHGNIATPSSAPGRRTDPALPGAALRSQIR
ncbi:arsenate reductase ArsC [Paracoccus sp. PAR01]|uniref:arsenate reductase/protein-tyrosine-phosphatase family protein n=1 Tax=Paracoccus sp. PAR01 TaxID=2769282 RepID=UPI00177EFC93|nr:arsenate reductase ArsC [Paracoccus sp. PAR01]MBD9529420.1 arsenate reductase ArsC [Paracoccus sp. PAR01]